MSTLRPSDTSSSIRSGAGLRPAGNQTTIRSVVTEVSSKLKQIDSGAYTESQIERIIERLGFLKGKHGNTAFWAARATYVPEEGEIILYDDYRTQENGQGRTVVMAGVKVGDGMAYVADLPFLTDWLADDLQDHAADDVRHITAEERALWSRNVADVDEIAETLIFNR